VDGRPWRTVPDAVVVNCRLAVGIPLERPLLRRLRTELRDAEALAAAGRVLRRRDVSRQALEERLARTGVAAGPRERAVAALGHAGAVDDRRLAERRSTSLAERGWGDEAIRVRLESEGVGPADVAAALARLAPEAERAARVASGARDARHAWSLLSRRGFGPETVADALDALDADDSSGLG
jgi:SOS response regulatory protein OraA/RecX